MLFLVLSAIAGAITVISGIITMLAAIKSHPGTKPQQQRFGWGLTIATLLLTLVFWFASMQPSSGRAATLRGEDRNRIVGTDAAGGDYLL